MHWHFRIRNYDCDPIIIVRGTPFYTVQGRKKKGKRSAY